MPSPLSTDLRKRIIEAKLRGEMENRIVPEKSVSNSTVTKLWYLYRRTGSYEASPNQNGRKALLSQHQLKQIRQSIESRPNITLQELKDKLDLQISLSTL